MPIQVLIPAPMRSFTGNKARVPVEGGATVLDVLTTLAAEHPGIGPRIFEAEGRLRRFVNVYHNGDDIRGLQGESTPVKDGDEIGIIPAMAGGRGR
jgi:molybdopterin converting factor small subunit